MVYGLWFGDAQPSTINDPPSTLNPQRSAPNPQPSTLNGPPMVAIIIIPTALKAVAEKCTAQLSPGSEGDSFIVPLWPAGKLDGEPTHWASLPGVSDETWEQIRNLANSYPFLGIAYVTSCENDECAEAFAKTLEQYSLSKAEDLRPRVE